MKAVTVDPRSRRVALQDVPEPCLDTSTQVRIKVEQVGVCATDRNILMGLAGKPPPNAKVLVLGHEMAGRVVELGREVKSLRLGDSVVATTRRGCLVCEACSQGQSDLCYSGLYTERGVWEAHGFLSELAVEEEVHLVPVPSALEEVAVLAKPLSTVVKALELVQGVQRRSPARCGHEAHAWDRSEWPRCKRVVVAGAEATGMLAALWLMTRGAEVYLYSSQADESPPAALIRQAGGRHISGQRAPVQELADWVREADLVLETTGDPAAPFHLSSVMAPNAVMVLLSTSPRRSDQSLDIGALANGLVQRNQAVVGCAASGRRHLERAVEVLQELDKTFRGLPQRLITHRYPLAQFRTALTEVPSGIIKAVIQL